MQAATSEQVPGLETQPASYFYTGKPYDAAAEAYSFAYRTFDPEIVRWTSADPSGFPDEANAGGYHSVPTSELDYAGLVTISWTYSDEVSVGATSASITTATQGTVKAVKVGNCWVAMVDKAYSFNGTGTVTLPKVGESFTYDGNTANFDQTFHDTTAQHEGWHVNHNNNSAGKTYTALESWSSGYSSNMFKTQSRALDAGKADFAAALGLAAGKFGEFYNLSGGHSGGETTGFFYDNTAQTWRSQLPNWGGPLNGQISSSLVLFQKTKGDLCE